MKRGGGAGRAPLTGGGGQPTELPLGSPCAPVPGPPWPPGGLFGQLAMRRAFAGDAHGEQAQSCLAGPEQCPPAAPHTDHTDEVGPSPLQVSSYCCFQNCSFMHFLHSSRTS